MIVPRSRTSSQAAERLATVIIPTLMLASELPELVEVYAHHPRIGEILIVNNSQERLHFTSEKVRVLQQQENIFVNASWNLGFEEARFGYLIISNDDILIAASAIDHGLKVLDTRKYGVLGLDPASRWREVPSRPKARVASDFYIGFGCLMFLRRADYQLIPSSLKIYGGDDWLFWRQCRPCGQLVGHTLATDMAVTSGRAEFDAVKHADREFLRDNPQLFQGIRKWHASMRCWERQRRLRAGVRLALSALHERGCSGLSVSVAG